MEQFYQLLAAHNARYVWVGALLIVTGVITAYMAFVEPGRRQAPLKAWLMIACYWQVGPWVLANFMQMPRDQQFRTAYNYVELFIALLLFLVALFFLIDLIKWRKIELSVPEARWEQVAVVILLAIAVLYPLYMMLWGWRYPNLQFLGLGPFPTFMFVGAILAVGLPRAPRLMVLALLLANLSAFVALAGGMWENVIMVLPTAYIVYALIARWHPVVPEELPAMPDFEPAPAAEREPLPEPEREPVGIGEG